MRHMRRLSPKAAPNLSLLKIARSLSYIVVQMNHTSLVNTLFADSHLYHPHHLPTMLSATAPQRLQSLLFSAIVAGGLLFAGCAESISGPEMDPITTSTVQTANNGGAGGSGSTGDTNDDCSVDPYGCQGRTGD